MTASALSFRISVLLGLAGIAWGIFMAATHDHSTMPAHAHLNLLGWVSLFMFGVYYRLHPAADANRLALVQIGAWCIGTLVLIPAVAAIHSGYMGAEAVAAVSSFFVLGSMALFAVLVFRPPPAMACEQLAPAE